MIVVGIIGLLAAIAIPNFIRARGTTQQTACWNTLRQFNAAKDQYALESGLDTGGTINPSTVLNEYLVNLTVTSTCPGGGTYSNMQSVGTPVTCSKHGRPTT
jgi:type II secretory pathway pseudopilin PulG